MSIQEVKVYVGVDVGSKFLDLFYADSKKSVRVANSPSAIEELCEELKGKAQYMLVLEASGGYETLLTMAMDQQAIAYAVVNAKRVRDFARSMGNDAKTDSIDAKVIAKFAEVLKPVPMAAQTEAERKHAALVTRRTQLVDLITQERNRLKQSWDTDAKKSVQNILKSLEKELNAVDQKLSKMLAADEKNRRKIQILQSAKGIGDVATSMILAHLPEIGKLNREKIAKLVGVHLVKTDQLWQVN